MLNVHLSRSIFEVFLTDTRVSDPRIRIQDYDDLTEDSAVLHIIYARAAMIGEHALDQKKYLRERNLSELTNREDLLHVRLLWMGDSRPFRGSFSDPRWSRHPIPAGSQSRSRESSSPHQKPIAAASQLTRILSSSSFARHLAPTM